MINDKLIRIGKGNIGGKALGIEFSIKNLQLDELNEKIKPHKIIIPESTVIATDEFDNFVDSNKLIDCIEYTDDEKIKQKFLEAKFRPWLSEQLNNYLQVHETPLAIRSSSISEDAYNHPFAGLYATVIIPNNHQDIYIRQSQLESAIKIVFASTFYQNSKKYLRNNKLNPENEKMAVLIQPLAGTQRQNYYYPAVAGVSQSLNFFPVPYLKTVDGITLMVLGLGKKVVEGGTAMRFSPRYPLVRPQFQTNQDIWKNSQQHFFALDLTSGYKSDLNIDSETIVNLEINIAEKHDVIKYLASTWDDKEQILCEGTFKPGYRILTFNKLLNEEIFPLPSLLKEILQIYSNMLKAPVDIEWALDFVKHGRKVAGNFYFLQVRTLPSMDFKQEVKIPSIPKNKMLIESYSVLGHGKFSGIKHIIYVLPEKFKTGLTEEIAKQVAILNDRISSISEDYILIGPGRWGCANPQLGIPVSYSQISNARIIGEMSLPGFKVEPSQGTHFFYNITSGKIGYFAINYNDKDFVNYDWFSTQPDNGGLSLVKHIIISGGIETRINGVEKKGVVFLLK